MLISCHLQLAQTFSVNEKYFWRTCDHAGLGMKSVPSAEILGVLLGVSQQAKVDFGYADQSVMLPM